MNRRKYILTTGGVIALAGCSETDPSDPPEVDSTTNEPSDEPDEPVDPEYSAEFNLEGKYDTREDEEIDLVGNVGIEKTLDGEAEEIDSEHYEILEAYQVREQEEYDTEFFEHNDIFYREVTEQVQNNELTISQLLPGQIKLGLEIQVEDGEHTETVNTEASTHVEAGQEQLQEEVFVEDDQLWETLREQYLEEELKNGYGGEFWDIANDIKDNLMPEIRDKEITRQYELIAREWIDQTRSHTGRPGLSPEANYLTNTIEYLIEDTSGIRNQDTDHDSTLAHNKRKSMTAGVENRRRGETSVPPKELGFLLSEKGNNRSDNGKNTLLNPDLDIMWSTLSSIGELTRPRDDSQFSFGKEYRETAAERLLNDEQVGELYEFNKPLGLSRELSPSMDFHVEGTADEPELEIRQ